MTAFEPGVPGAPLRSCVIGTGAIAEQHLPWIAASDLATLDAVVDMSPALATYAAERHGAALATTDIEEALERAPDVVHVLTPPSTHGALVAQALDAGAHVVCEKPLAPSAPAAADLLEHAAKVERRLIENHNYRFNPEVRDLCALVGAGRLGAVREVEVRIALDVTGPGSRFGDPNIVHPVHGLPAGVVHDFLTHLTYLPLLLLPALEVDEVWARLSGRADDTAFGPDDLDAVVLGSTPSGPVRLRVRFDPTTRPECLLLRVRGTAGTAAVELFQRRVERQLARGWAGKLAPVVDQVVGAFELGRSAVGNLSAKLRGRTAYEGIGVLLERHYHAILTGGPPPVTPDDILAASRLADRLVAAGSRS